jgi:hypothetical protein
MKDEKIRARTHFLFDDSADNPVSLKIIMVLPRPLAF